jgi:flagellar export protein FliJ
MKRFQSRLQKVHDILQQQCRMAELEFARARAQLSAAEQKVEQAIEEFHAARQDVRSALLTTQQISAILVMQQHLDAAQSGIQKRKTERDQAEQVCQQARQKYQSIHSQVERIEKLIEKQREEHHQEMLKGHQQTLDDVALFRWNAAERETKEVNFHG